MSIAFDPIGHFHCEILEKYLLPSQPGKSLSGLGTIRLNPHSNFEQALSDLDTFERIWILFYFNKSVSWRPKVMPPRGGIKRGVFATRSPHRPNSIGMSCVRLIAIKGLNIIIDDHDLLDQTPILDIKPYLSYADSYPDASQGWLEGVSLSREISLEISAQAQEKFDWLLAYAGLNLIDPISFRIKRQPLPYPNNRISILEKLSESDWKLQMAYKAWRITYLFRLDSSCVFIVDLDTGYDVLTLSGIKNDEWNQINLHQAFRCAFPVLE